MDLELLDSRLRASLRFLTDDRARLVLTFPREEAYCNRVMTALAELLRPAPVETSPTSESAGTEEVQ